MVVLLVLPLNIRLYGSELVANTLAYNTSPLITTVKSFTVLAQVLTVQTQCLTRKNKKIILQDLLYMGLTITNTLAYYTIVKTRKCLIGQDTGTQLRFFVPLWWD